MTHEDPIVIVAATRTPSGQFGGIFKNTPAQTLGAATIHSLLSRSNVPPKAIDEVLMGCVLPAGLGQAPARQAALAAGIPNSTPATTVNKMCGSGMKTIMQGFDSIVAGSNQITIAGGMENMSRAPYLIPKARFGYRLGHGELVDHMMLDGLEDAYDKGCAMGVFAERCASKFSFTREAQDDFACCSVARAQQAERDGLFGTEISPVTIHTKKGEQVIAQDEGPSKISIEKIPKLKPAFQKDGTVTAANSSSIADGAAAVLLMKHSTAKHLNLKPMAKLLAHHTFAQAPECFTTAPVGAIKGLCDKISWSLNDVDLFEINEAFAVVTMVTMRELNLPHEKVNVHGGACVLGHPIGASGARIVVTLLHALKQRKQSRGIASLCIGGGEATAIAVEML